MKSAFLVSPSELTNFLVVFLFFCFCGIYKSMNRSPNETSLVRGYVGDSFSSQFAQARKENKSKMRLRTAMMNCPLIPRKYRSRIRGGLRRIRENRRRNSM